MKAIVIRGDFTEAEFAELVAHVRQIDDRRPHDHFEIVAVDPDQDSEMAEQMIRAAVPPQEGRQTDFAVYKRVR